MTLEQLRIFIAAAEREHMTRAAEVLNLTQSAVSAAIQSLEARHEVALFNRIGRGIELTEAGRLFLVQARAVLAQAREAELVLADLADLSRGTLAISASQTIASYWLPPRIVRFHADYPRLDLNLRVGTTAQVTRDMLDGSANIGFIEGAAGEPLLEQTVVGHDRLVLVVGARHPWFGRGSLDVADLVGTPWIFRERGSAEQSELVLVLRQLGVPVEKLSVGLELPTNNAVRAAVVAGAGAAGLSQLVVEDALCVGSLFQLPITMPDRVFHALHHRERKETKALKRFIDYLPMV